jgi:hypothetical protein
MFLCKKIKIEVSARDAATLEFMQDKCRGLYNWWVMKLRGGELWPGWREAKSTLRASRKLGFPRVKPRHQFFTLCYPAMYLDKIYCNTIILPTGGGRNWGHKRYRRASH